MGSLGQISTSNSWRTSTFRQCVAAKIEEVIRQNGIKTYRNSVEMENYIFQKATNKDEYLGFVARLILYIREMKFKQVGCIAVRGQGQGGPGMPNPSNALPNLISQGTRNSMMKMGPQIGEHQQDPATNLLQTLNRGPQQMMMGNPMGHNMPSMQDRQNINMDTGNARRY